MSDYARWYRVGTVALTKNSKIVTGTGTFWLSAGLKPGDMFSVDDVTEYEVASIDSNTQLTLKTIFTGDSTSEAEYRIIRNFTSTMSAQVAAHATDLLNDFRQFVDLKMQTIHGKSAYQIACDKGFAGTESQWLESLHAPDGKSAYEVAVENGFTGTVEEWLESLLAAGQWQNLDSRTEVLANNNAGLHNSIYRGKNLGAFTAEHLAAIKAITYKDMWIGDYFINTVTRSINSVATRITVKDIIAGFRTGVSGVLMIRETPLINCDDYISQFNRAPSGTEGEEDYDPGTKGNLYPTSNWYTVVRPKFIEEIEGIYGASNLVNITITVPAGMNGINATSWVHLTSKAHLPTLNMVGFPQIPFASHSDWTYLEPKLPLVSLRNSMDSWGIACAEAFRNSNNTQMLLVKAWNQDFYLDPNNTMYRGTVPGGGHALNPIFCIR